MLAKKIVIPVVLLIAILVSGIGEAGNVKRMAIPMAEAAVIAPTDEPTRQSVLVKPDMKLVTPNSRVILAVLCIAIDQIERSPNSFAVRLELMPLARQWDAEHVSWDQPWVTPGGDVLKGFHRSFLLKQPGRACFDVTRLVQRWLNGTSQNYGLLVRTDSMFGGRISVDLSSGQGDGSGPAELSLIVLEPGL
jgi:hypothetical protein